MSQHIKITTDFDITNTGVVRNFKPGVLPLTINSTVIKTEQEWIRARRQQSNWETLVQVISLRTQPLNLRTVINESSWVMEFDTEYQDVYRINDDNIGLLKEDCNNVPLLVDLTEQKTMNGFIIISGSEQNMWFSVHDL